jgi:hypothetical protein
MTKSKKGVTFSIVRWTRYTDRSSGSSLDRGLERA